MVLLVGINGAGKTTFYYTKIKPFHDANGMTVPFVNADEIEKANKLSDSYIAAKHAARLREQYLADGQSFVAETVFSHPSKIDLIGEAQTQGFEVVLNHVHVEDSELAYARVQTRIAMGGHPVPKIKVRERFPRTYKNIQQAAQKADRTYVWPIWAKEMYSEPVEQYSKRINALVDYARTGLNKDSSLANKQAIANILTAEKLSKEQIDKVFADVGGYVSYLKVIQ